METNYVALLLLFSFLLNQNCAKSVSLDQRSRPANTEMDVFLLIGQSNMQGVAPIGILDTLTLENVYLFNDENKWEPARNLPGNGMNRYSTVKRRPVVLFGPAYTFGRKIHAYSKRAIGIVSNARGATRIEWWLKGYSGENDFDLYEEAINRAKAALAANPGARIRGVLWHQGEGDYTPERSALYMSRLKTLVGDLRKDLGDPKLPFIAGEVGTWNGRGTLINPIIRDIKTHIVYSDWVSSEGLTSIDVAKNDAHFDNLSQRVFGGRYADKAASLVYKVTPQGVTLFNGTNYVGRSILLGTGKYTGTDLESMGIYNNEILSLKLDPGYELTIYVEGGSKVFRESDPEFAGPVPESVQVVKRN